MTVDADNPYVGLRPFARDDSLRFFGRREQTDELLAALESQHFLAVVGGSGCGKSSLVRAGLIPELLGGFLVEERDRWSIAALKPGDDPLRNLAVALLEATTGGEAPPGEVEALREAVASRHTLAVFDHLLQFLGEDGNLLLLVDQFEEIFAFRGSQDEERLARSSPAAHRERARRRQVAADFVDLLLELGRQAELPVYVVLTMRTDFLGDCDLFYGLPEAMNRGRYLVPRLTRQQLRQAIVGPARLSGTRLEARLLDRLLNELGDRTDRLPVLQHALYRTWEQWRAEGGKGGIDLEHFREVGTLESALSIHAEEALQETDLEAAARVFKCLTDTDTSNRRVRRPAALSEVVAETGLSRDAVEDVLERFRSGGRNFVFLSAGPAPGDPRVDVSHESLIRQWGRLRDWVDEERESRERFVDLVRDARREAAGRRGLLQNPELQLALDWRQALRPGPRWAARYSWRDDDFEVAMGYLDRSQELFGSEALRRRRRRRRVLLASGLLVALALSLLTTWALHSRRKALRLEAKGRGQMRVAVAGEWNEKDPTMAALTLLGVSATDTPYAVARMREAIDHGIAQVELRGHEDKLWWGDFSADGEWIVTASLDHTARVWRSDGTGEPIVLRGHEDVVREAGFSPDGKRIVTTSDDKTARVWSLEGLSDGRLEPIVLKGHDATIWRGTFSPDGTRVVTASSDGTARVWPLNGDGDPVVLEHEKWVERALFSPDGTRVATASRDGTARIWNADGSGQPIVLEGHDKEIYDVDFSPDGSLVVTASADGTARVWSASDSGEARRVFRGHKEAVWSAAFSPKGGRIVTASKDKTARVWSLGEEDAKAVVLMGHADTVARAGFSPDGTRVVTASYDGTSRVWRADGAGEPVILRGHRDVISRAVFEVPDARQVSDPEGTRVLTTSFDGTARVWPGDGSGDALVLRGHGAGIVWDAAFSPDGSRLVSASADGTARVWGADDGAKRLVIRGHEGQVTSAAFSPDGSRIVTASVDKTARVWRADGDGRQEARQEAVLRGHADSVTSAVFSPDGGSIVTASLDETARVWSVDGTQRVMLRHPSKVNGAAFSPDGAHIVTASSDKAVRVWRSDGEGDPTVLKGHDDQVWTAVFSADGSRIVTASADGTARVWSATGEGEPTVLRGHGDWVLSAAFSPDDSRIVTASNDGTVRVWRADGVEEQVLRGHRGFVVQRATFDPLGAKIVSASHDGTARVWSTRAPDLQRIIRDSTTVCLPADFRQKYLGESAATASRRSADCARARASGAYESPEAAR